jgi:hypothetical protein
MGIVIPDAPHDTKWFTRKEAVMIVSRKRDDHHIVDKRQLKWNQVIELVKDPKTYLFFLYGVSANLPGSGTANCKCASWDLVSNKTDIVRHLTMYSWHPNHQRVRVQHAQHDPSSGPVWHLDCHRHVSAATRWTSPRTNVIKLRGHLLQSQVPPPQHPDVPHGLCHALVRPPAGRLRLRNRNLPPDIFTHA